MDGGISDPGVLEGFHATYKPEEPAPPPFEGYVPLPPDQTLSDFQPKTYVPPPPAPPVEDGTLVPTPSDGPSPFGDTPPDPGGGAA